MSPRGADFSVRAAAGAEIPDKFPVKTAGAGRFHGKTHFFLKFLFFPCIQTSRSYIMSNEIGRIIEISCKSGAVRRCGQTGIVCPRDFPDM
jgi:hypothetical protein